MDPAYQFLNSKKQNASKHKQIHRLKNRHTSRGTASSHSRSDVGPSNQSHDLPAVQCKDVLLLDYDHNAQYSKRKISSNTDRYKDLSDHDDDDDENSKMSAADFDQLLSKPTSFGGHFTFAAERSWTQNDDLTASNDGSLAKDLFKLNTSILKDGLGKVPFYLRQGLKRDMFTEGEIADMNHRAECTTTHSQANQNLLNILISKPKKGFDSKETTLKVEIKSVPPKKAAEITTVGDELAELLRTTQMKKPQASFDPVQTSVPVKNIPMSSQAAESKPKSNVSKSKTDKHEDIQDWLDDILNED